MTDLHESSDPKYAAQIDTVGLDICRLCCRYYGHRGGGSLSWRRRDDREYRRIARRGIARLESVTAATAMAAC
jgi:hypothetical protein